jgi:hypothetical protein
MRSKEFEVARGLIAGRGPEAREHAFTGHAPAPASFREIDGDILARQYVAHRKFLETEALALQFENSEGHPGGIRSTKLRGERRPEQLHGDITRDAKPDGWLSSFARFLWRR